MSKSDIFSIAFKQVKIFALQFCQFNLMLIRKRVWKCLKIDFSILEGDPRTRSPPPSWVHSLALLLSCSLLSQFKSTGGSGWVVQVNTPSLEGKSSNRCESSFTFFARTFVSIDRDRFRGNFVWYFVSLCALEAGWCGNNNTINDALALVKQRLKQH